MTTNFSLIDNILKDVFSKKIDRNEVIRQFEALSDDEKEQFLGKVRLGSLTNSVETQAIAGAIDGDRNRDASAETLIFQEYWQEVPLDTSETEVDIHASHAHRTIVFSDENWLKEQAADANAAPVGDVIYVVRGDRFQKLSDRLYCCRANDEVQLQTLFRRLVGEAEEASSVIYAWSKGKAEAGIHELFTLFKAIRPFASQISQLTLLGHYDHQSLDSCWDYAWIGFQRSLKPHYPATDISIVYSESTSIGLKQVIALSSRESVMWLRGEQACRLSVRAVDVAQNVQAAALKQHGGYLITGGVGALGFTFARHLASHYQAKLILVGRRPLSDAIRKQLNELKQLGAREAVYEMVDVRDELGLTSLALRLPFELAGVIHAAGVESDKAFFEKSAADVRQVMGPKTIGTLLLDQIFGQQPLDFICYFSSSAALLGDFGGCDYAIANRFQMGYGDYREQNPRFRGKTIVINWPLWDGAEGGMGARHKERADFYLKTSGQKALSARDGIPLWCDLVQSGSTQSLVMIGDARRITSTLQRFYERTPNRQVALSLDIPVVAHPETNAAKTKEVPDDELKAIVATDLKRLISAGYKIAVDRLEESVHLAEYGLDSINLTELAQQLTAHFAIEITPALFFSYISIDQLSDYFVTQHRDHLQMFYRPAPAADRNPDADPPCAITVDPIERRSVRQGDASAQVGTQQQEPIAIIGMAGRFPDADTVDELWMLLSDSRNAITDIPETRWNWRDYFIAPGDSDNKITTNRGGFIRDIERFDALFFDISPREAQDMDPAQQLLLMESYRAIEDAGLSPQSIRGSRTAVFVGMEESQHEMLNGWRGITTGGAAMIASRLSYFLDLHGPAIVTNTACSSGLVALHQAAMSLRQGECDTALVASVALTLSPHSYMTMSRAGMLSPDGQCRSFAANANGIGVGEAVVVLMLKPLAAAIADGNPVHGVLRASGINFDGKTNGVTAPNGKMQAELIERIYADHKIDINDLGHIVAHGTGTKLGDPVEVNALHDAFKRLRARQPGLKTGRSDCAITSCKANLGHTMAASGLVSMVSLLQSIRHRQIPASLHCEEENPHFNRTDASLYVNRTRREWQLMAGKPRMGAVSAFGRSGTNAHVVIEEYLPAENIREAGPGPNQHAEVAIALSARTAEQLRQKVRDLLHFTDRLEAGGGDENKMRLTDVAYTLQTGRDAMAYRLGLIVGSFGELQAKLRAYLDDAKDIGNLFRGDAKPDPHHVRALARDKETLAAAREWLAARRLPELLELWVKGFDLDWQRLYGDDQPRRVSLPAYPFAGETYRLRNAPESRAYATRGAEQDEPFGRSKAIMPSPSGKSAVASGQPPLVVIGGAGLFGLCMGVFLKKANIPFRIIEKNEDVGGVWFVNRWPGCGCDIPMLAYAYSFEHFTGDIWAKQPDILKYLQGIARKYDLYSHITFNTKIREASWREEAGQWLLTFENEETIAAKYYIHAANEGQGHVGNIPNIPGMDKFQGSLMHALDCRADDWDFAGKRIAIIGNGTTQIQLVETLQPVAERLVVYARSPKYIYPRATYGRKTQEKLGSDYQFWLKHRGEYLATADEFYAISNDPVQINPFHPYTQIERYFSRDMNDDWRSFYQWLREIDMVPDYSPGCSRPCMSHTYHHQIRADNVELKTVPAARITATGIETEKDAEAFDIILLATGYDLHDFKPRITIRGRNRLELNEYFGDFPKSHAGIAVSHFPNFFLASGPNSGTNATSITAIYEHSCENFVEIIRYCEANHVTSIEAKEAETEKFVAFVRERNQAGSFSSGCSSWYQTKQGENVAVFPGTFEELKQWRTFNPEQYHFEYADSGPRRDIAGYSARQPALESRTLTAESVPQSTLEMPEDRRGRREWLDSPAVTEQMMADHVQGIITEKLSAALEIDPNLIDYDASFADYGIDSILGAELVQSVNAILEVKLETNHLFDYGSVEKLSGHVLSVWGAAVRARLTETRYTAAQMKAKDIPAPAGEAVDLRRPALSVGSKSATDRTDGFKHDPIAIIGMSGRFADSESVDAFWQNLRDGKDLVKEISRWDKTECISPGSTETTYCSRGSFVESVDLFDPAFFRISPLEAMYMDPQQRIFLEECWTALEYAGYAGKGMDKKRCGVFAGCSRSEYAQFFSEEPPAQAFWGNAPSIIPARIAYYLNLLGPAISVDTACSSSLVSIHLACQSLWARETDMSLAGGVFLQLKPDYHQVTNRAGMLSLEGKCRAFDAGANGFVPGEGVGVVVLKRLQDALEDGDTIHGVIAGSGMNQDGSTNGITAPSAQSQQRLELSVYEQFQIDPETIQLVEAHGTGTRMGDPVEFKALTDAFRHYTDKTQYCAIGSVKANIGHATLAAGIASVLKVLMALKHRQIPALLHFQEANPAIDFASSPFYPCTELSDWHVADDQRRRAAISSFGISGTNAHMVIEEMPEAPPAAIEAPGYLVVLSARTAEQLKQQVGNLLALCKQTPGVSMNDMSHTLFVGRMHLIHRFACIARSQAELVQLLEQWLATAGKAARDSRVYSSVLPEGKVREQGSLKKYGNQCIQECRHTAGEVRYLEHLATIAELYVQGYELDFQELFARESKRIPLPTYPFARERHWVDAAVEPRPVKAGLLTEVLHPLLHRNTSDLAQQRYSSVFSGEEFFLRDHQINGQKILPAVAYLEMVRAAVMQALPDRPEAAVLELLDIVWLKPLTVAASKQVSIDLSVMPSPDGQDLVGYEVYSLEGEERILHSQGKAALGHRTESSSPDIRQLQTEMKSGHLDAADIYSAFTGAGVNYGPAHRGIASIQFGDRQCLARLALPSSVESGRQDYELHPSLMDSALQASINLLADISEVSNQVSLPFALEALRVLSPCTSEMMAWVRFAEGSRTRDKVAKLDIDLMDRDGQLCVQIQGLSFRALGAGLNAGVASARTESLLTVPAWEPRPVPAGKASLDDYHVILCEMPAIDPAGLEARLPGSRCQQLQATQGHDIAERYSQHALACFEQVQGILKGRPRGKVLIQIVVPDHPAQTVFAGLSGLLKTTALENPLICGQMIIIDPKVGTEHLADRLRENQAAPSGTVVRYQDSVRHVQRWREMQPAETDSRVVFQDQGVYLIIGGMGGLGMIFTREILRQVPNAHVILTGRSPLTEEQRIRLEALSSRREAIDYRQLDLCNAEQMTALIGTIEGQHKRLNGILHCAGMIADQFILNKTAEEFRQILAPKVTGTWYLDQASRHLDLDFMVLFSSQASAIGSMGQADYAAANGFMDQFAAYRNKLVADQERRGKTLSINWPVWQDGGMTVDPAILQRIRENTGMHPMQTDIGLLSFYRSLGSGSAQVGVMEGDLPQIRQLLFSEETLSQPVPEEEERTPAAPPAPSMIPAPDSLLEKTQDFLAKQLSALLKLPASRIDPQAPLEQYGIDSILTVNLTNQLEKTFGALSKTLLFEYQSIRELAEYFTTSHADKLAGLFAPADRQPAEKQKESPAAAAPISDAQTRTAPLSVSGRRPLQHNAPAIITSPPAAADEPIAIIGLSGRYPQAFDIHDYWQNLSAGKDCITEVPKERWDWRQYFSEDRSQIGYHFSKWGGFIEGVDEFDPFFFNMSPREAEYTDPQERLFLQHAWMAVEDAGYTRAGLQVADEQDLAGQVGVYVGVMYGEYQLFGAEASLRGNRMGFAVSLASIANRVSYVLNLHGPSMTLDTMCSSSLTAIHLACQDLKQRRTSLAIAGGVNTTVHPNKYLMLSAGQFISSEGRCQSFGVGGDGYIPAEGVGVVVLKRLSEAQKDQDHIYGVIKGSALNHGGKTNGYTVPNPQAQTAAIRRALAESGTNPRHISYIEAHGTGTKLGDPIEIAGLTKAFGQHTKDTGFCFVGSAKSNIGHGESAAGIAGLTKVLLQMKHRKIAPSLHSAVLNPNIDFDRTPFVVNQSLRDWENPVIDGQSIPRIAGISSFGAGGSNAHLILEEYLDSGREDRQAAASHHTPGVVVLSARNEPRLREMAENLQAFIAENPGLALSDVAYTLQVGREAMEERLGILANSTEQLSEKLGAWLAGEQDLEDLWQGQAKRNDETIALFSGDADLQETIDRWIAQRKYPKLLDLWVKGLNPDWNKLYGDDRPYRISLPAYPFARDRYWTPEGNVSSSGGGQPSGHGSLLSKLQQSMTLKPPPIVEQTTVVRPDGSDDLSWDQLSYRPVWNEQPASRSVRQDRMLKRILLVHGESILQLEKDILAECRRKHPEANVTQIRLGQTTRRISDTEWSCDVDDPEGFHLCLKGEPTPDCILFVAAVPKTQPSADGNLQIQHSAADEIQLLRLVKTLQQLNEAGTVTDCFILTLDNHQPDDTQNESDGGGLTGLAYAIAQGDRRFLVRNVDLSRGDLAGDETRDAALKMMLDELPSDRGTAVKIKSGRRYQQSFLKWQWDAESKSPGLRDGGVYLIAGGSGTVGQIITRHLIERYRAKVVWLGRSAENDPSLQKKLALFQERGTTPWYVQADVTQGDSLRQAIDKVKQRYAVLNGAIFSSLVFHPENSISGTTEQEFVDILDVKITGSRHFYAALENEPLDFLCYFSSVQSFSFLSAKDSVGYATGITFADAAARSQRHRSRFPVGIINWGYWEATVKGTPLEGPLSARFGLIQDQVGTQFFDRFVSHLQKGGTSQLLCMPASQPLQEMMGLRENEVSYLSSQANPSLFARLKEEYYEQA